MGTGFSIVDCACDPCHGSRNRREIGKGDDAYFGLLALRHGREHVEQADKTVTLAAGDMMIWDASLPCRFSAEGPISKTTLFIKRELLRDVTGSDALEIGAMDVSGGWGRCYATGSCRWLRCSTAWTKRHFPGSEQRLSRK
ncbi:MULTISPECIES: hypothetical protein [unclassified Ruegeria]|uniref:AraC-like ligand-binding domain-containing protein n=1 Tax=unclassified Ruegeria TaxID=2625375 RepID=UPI001487DA2E